mgnify:CR=1 FL=1
MNSSGAGYTRLYNLQDRFLQWFVSLDLPFYLTGGTALGRFYLNHRYSNDLDFFVNNDPFFNDHISIIRKYLEKQFTVDIHNSLFSDDFTRVFIEDENLMLKIELVNEIEYRAGKPVKYAYGLIDTLDNILSNKLSAIISRDEPKDIYDIIYLAMNYSFNWKEIFYHAKHKAVINEIDVERRLTNFPVSWLSNVNWLNAKPDIDQLKKKLETIADDFLLGKDNTLGKNKPRLEEALPIDLTK